ncbi:MAG TPA: LytTR family DNA-binding domain-containing protein [Pricia sp.]|nr:LytTR family DNA-binding domain-containing protein [Pricia sp.]
MIRCIIIEDQPPAQRVLQRYIDDMDTLELKSVFADALKAMDFLKNEPVDLIFLDIHLPKISGIDFLKALPHKPHVILTTAFSDYALESYEYQVVDYLLKPFSFERFVKAVSKVPLSPGESARKSEYNATIDPVKNGSSRNHSIPEIIFIKSGYEHLKIRVADIQFIQSEADYTEIFTKEKKHLTSHSLKHWLGTLSDARFVQVHKSYIVNVTKIMKVSGNSIFFDKDTLVPIGRAFKDDFTERYLK